MSVEACARYRWQHQWARGEQLPPEGDWATWLLLAGRGAGKTRVGAEWLAFEAVSSPGTRWAVIAPTAADARDTCVEGSSGLLPVLHRYGQVQAWNRSLGELRLVNGSRIRCFSADEPDRLRGPQHSGLWADELAAWTRPETWDMAQFGLRLGDRPRAVVSTTPKPTPLVRGLIAARSTVITRGSTFDNAGNLSAVALERLRERYEGTRLGRQELYGELLTDVEGALWSRDLFDAHRVPVAPPDLVKVVVGVDPAMTAGPGSDLTGIVVAAVAADRRGYVLADLSGRFSPQGWARAVADAVRKFEADEVIAEVNGGGDLVVSNLRTADAGLRVRKVTASRGKAIRAQPIASLYEKGSISHVGSLDALEDQMATWTPGDASPDRMDAAVWALHALMVERREMRPVQVFRYR